MGGSDYGLDPRPRRDLCCGQFRGHATFGHRRRRAAAALAATIAAAAAAAAVPKMIPK